jgi:hypothetical protein
MSEECSCDDKSKIGATVKIHCKICATVLEKYTIKKPFKSALIAMLLAYGGGQTIEYAVTDNRYPLNIEYAVLNACTSSYQQALSYVSYDLKETICLCALEDTMNEIS